MDDNNKLLSLLINSLALLLSALLAAVIILYLMGHPQLLQKPAPEGGEAPVLEAPTVAELSLGKIVDGKDAETGFVAERDITWSNSIAPPATPQNWFCKIGQTVKDGWK